MSEIDKLLEFAEQVAKEDEAKMQKYDAKKDFINKALKEKYPTHKYEYNPCFLNMMRGDIKVFIYEKIEEFNANYKEV